MFVKVLIKQYKCKQMQNMIRNILSPPPSPDSGLVLGLLARDW